MEDQDAFRLLALLLDKLLRGGRGSRPAKQDGLTVSVMELRALAVRSPNSDAVVRGSWRRKSRNQLEPRQLAGCGRGCTLVLLAWDDLASGEVLLGYCWARMGAYGWSMVCWPVLSICQIGRIEEGAQSPRLSVPLILCEMQQLLSNGLVYIMASMN